MITIVIYIIRIKILYNEFCSSPLQNEISPISRNIKTTMVSGNLLEAVFKGLPLLTNHFTFCMKMLIIKTLLSLFLKDVGSIQKRNFPTNGNEVLKMFIIESTDGKEVHEQTWTTLKQAVKYGERLEKIGWVVIQIKRVIKI
jgi:hypothetical protein